MNKKENKITIIVESPNKIKTIHELLKDTPYKEAKVVASVGHITHIEDGGGYYNTGIDNKNNFKPNFKIDSGKENIFKELKQLVKISDVIFLCTDDDREGEAIAWSLKEFLKIPTSKCYRATFHEITKNAVLDALNNPRKIDSDLVHASHARQKMDKLLGYRLSRVANKNIGAKSVGRCQSAGLELITEKEALINSFVPEKYGELIAYVKKNNQEFKAKYFDSSNPEKKPSYETCLEVSNIIDANLKKGGTFVVENIERKSIKSNPKPPFITSTFQQEVSNKLGIGVEQAMSYAQKLFEGLNVGGKHIALITYIRTDDASFSPEFLDVLEKYVKNTFGVKYYSPVKEVRNNELAQAGHEAIRPVDLEMTPEKLANLLTDKNLVKVYDIIYRRTIACAMSQSITSETIYTLNQGGFLFNMTSKELLFDGYKKVYNYKDDKEEEDLIKETFEKDEIVKCVGLEVEEKATNPPARFKEASFIKELEKTGIGRPSTYATIVKTLKDESRGYVKVENKYLIPTEKGIQLAEFLKEKFPDLINVEYTSNMEKDLDLIAQGKLDEVKFLKEFLDTMEKAIKDANLSDTPMCPKCGAPMKLRHGPYGSFFGCTKYPECNGVIKLNKKD